MDEIKTAKCVGVMVITRINVECPYCENDIEIPYEEFVENIGEPWGGDHEGCEIGCPKCGKYFKLGEFEVQE